MRGGGQRGWGQRSQRSEQGTFRGVPRGQSGLRGGGGGSVDKDATAWKARGRVDGGRVTAAIHTCTFSVPSCSKRHRCKELSPEPRRTPGRSPETPTAPSDASAPTSAPLTNGAPLGSLSSPEPEGSRRGAVSIGATVIIASMSASPRPRKHERGRCKTMARCSGTGSVAGCLCMDVYLCVLA